MDEDRFERLVALRRDLHRHPEPAWREFYTTARIVEEIDRVGVDDVHVGPDCLADGERTGVPDDAELQGWMDRAREAGVDEATLERMEGGKTGVVAVLERGEGPAVALRVDIDALPRTESTDPEHAPAAEGFRSETEAMHACGHDAHAAIGIGVLEAVAESNFDGTLTVVFQPAEEVVGGGPAVAASGLLDDVEYLLAVHVGLGYPTGTVVAGMTDIFAVHSFEADFDGVGAHAANMPSEGRNAVQALATAVQNLAGIPRHEDGVTRVNTGVVEGGSAVNIVPERATLEGEVRGETDEVLAHARERAERVLEHSAAMHGCDVSITSQGEAPSAESDDELVELAYGLAGDVDGVESRQRRESLTGSEDATFLMQRVQEQGGLAAYVGVGTNHPDGHHTARFDVDEESIAIGVDWLTAVVLAIGERRP